MALGVNLLVFGAYQDSKGAFHFIFIDGEPTSYQPIFDGLLTGGPALFALGLLVFVFGHMIVLALGVTSAGLQAVRLEYVEFFGEFYEGGGDEYEPFGYERSFTDE
jgi:V/A-type H+-transporting ATPase subunit I